MPQLRSIGVFLIACSLIAGVIAWERYQTAYNTAKRVAEGLALEFVSVSPPIETKVAAIIGVILLVAGAKCLFDSLRKPETKKENLLG